MLGLVRDLAFAVVVGYPAGMKSVHKSLLFATHFERLGNPDGFFRFIVGIDILNGMDFVKSVPNQCSQVRFC